MSLVPETLPNMPAPAHDPMKLKWWPTILDASRERIEHGAWLRAVAESKFVGECRDCGSYMRPLPAEQVGDRFDYAAVCVNERQTRNVYDDAGVFRERLVTGCGKEVMAPGGAAHTKSSRLKERPRRATQG